MNAIYKPVAAGVVGALLVATLPSTARAEHHGDETAAAIFAGVAAVGIIAAIASHADADVQVSYANYRCAPPPPPRCEPPPRWIPGHYEIRREKVVQPGYWETVVEPAVYGWVRHGHKCRYVVVKPECRQRVWVPERCDWVETQVWVPGHHEGGRYAELRNWEVRR